MASKRSWSDLPTELLQIICEKLVEIDDYARFGVVCTRWRNALWLSRKKIPPQLPVLMCLNYSRNYSSGTHSHTHAFFRFSSAKTHNHDYFFSGKDFHTYGLPETKESIHRYCHGSSHGWLLAEAENNNFQLMNPFLSVNNVIKLPSLSGLRHIHKFVLSDNPAWTSDYIVAVVTHDIPCNKLAFLRPDDKSWILVDQEEWEDCILYKGQFYAISCSEKMGKMVSFNVTSSQLKLKTVASLRSLPIKRIKSMHMGYSGDCDYLSIMSLVEVSGDLLCVVDKTFHDYNNNCNKMAGFQIYKFETLESKWIKLRTLEKYALFVDNASSLCLLASDSGHCKPNRIYFIYESDRRVLNLENRHFEPLISRKFRRNFYSRQSVWVQPTLNMIRKPSGRGWPNLVCDARPNTSTLEQEQTISAQDEGKETHSRHLQIQQIAGDSDDSGSESDDYYYDSMSDEYGVAADDDYYYGYDDDDDEEEEENEGEGEDADDDE